VSRPTLDRPDDDEDLLAHLISRAGDPHVEPRPEHVASLRAVLLDRVGSARAARPWRTRLLMVSSLAAVCLLAVSGWIWHNVEEQVAGKPKGGSTRHGASRPPDDLPGAIPWLEARRVLDPSKDATFNWPLQETVSLMVSSSLPPDLLD
jgi:hypothetical protein